MLAQTQYQNVSGTRCAIDMVEIPSVLCEMLASDPNVILKGIKDEDKEAVLLSMKGRKNWILDALDKHRQLLLSRLDLKLHSSYFVSSSLIVKELEKDRYISHVDGTVPWHLNFGHLATYGSGYYSYTFANAIAQQIRHRFFNNDPWNQEAGRKWRDQFLRWGGEYDGWKLLGDVLEDPSLASGGTTAMHKISQYL